jgi:hypothetical protein
VPEARAPIPQTDPLIRIENDLAKEFADVDRRTLKTIASEALARYEGARIRDYTPVLAWRDARERLRRERLGVQRAPGAG